MKIGTPLARSPLLLKDWVDIVHFAQPLEERDEIQQLSVGHVVEPGGHGHLYGKNMLSIQSEITNSPKHETSEKQIPWVKKLGFVLTHRVVGMEDVGGGGVVHNNDLI